MRTSLEWIRSMVPELSCTAQEYMDAMTLSGTKVEGYEKFDADLDKIINYKNWKMIVTHNPLGEYGHVHHKMTSGMVTELADKDVLYYFGYYVSNLTETME